MEKNKHSFVNACSFPLEFNNSMLDQTWLANVITVDI